MLFWVLQHQVCYMAQLSTSIKAPDSDEAAVFDRVVEALFAEASRRTQHLFLMLLRLIVDKETEIPGQKIQDLFGRTSRAFNIFRRYALSEIHAKDLVHLYLLTNDGKDSKTDDGKDSKPLRLIEEVKDQTDQLIVFALDLEQYKRNMPVEDRNKEAFEINQDFAYHADKFREFMQKEFLEAVTKHDLPRDIQLFFKHVMQSVSSRQFQEYKDAGVPLEYRKVEPVLSLFCNGILIPICRDPFRFASREFYLQKSFTYLAAGAAGPDSGTQYLPNFDCIADFLEHMLGGEKSFAEKGMKMKIASSCSQIVKPKLMEYLLQQATKEADDLESQLMIDTYSSHFDRGKHPVTIATSDMLQISNMLKMYMNKLRIKEKDRLEEVCRHIPIWPPDFIQEYSRDPVRDHQRNFLMNTRFLFDTPTEEVVICRVSKRPIPRSLCGQPVSEKLIKCYQPQDADNPRHALETLFRELEPLTCKNFKEMRDEFQARVQQYKQRTPPNYEMMQRLQEGMRIIEELRNVEAHPKDVQQFMTSSLIERSRHRHYLNQVKKGVVKILEACETFTKKLHTYEKELQQSLNFSLELELPAKYKLHAGARPLKFLAISQTLKARMLNPKTMQDIGCTTIPIRTYPMKKLKKEGVITEVHPPYAVMEQKMKVTFRALKTGGVELVVSVATGASQNCIKTLVITEDKLQEMMQAGKDELVPLKNKEDQKPFFTAVCSKFVNLVTNLSTNREGGSKQL